MHASRNWLLALFAAALAGCASAPPQPTSAAQRAAVEARQMVGRPYRYGGATPAGFDCSGLVQFSYRHAGLALPRTTEAQRHTSRLVGRAPVKRAQLRRGDLLFFDEQGRRNSHVGIYLGEGRFVHAPSTGEPVRTERLDSPYWRRHLSEVRRLSS